ncbi:hypothetical protein MAPG_00447 [Magnaporthiopsis poae ATCC 64411]|uniref:Uncharacterized protein n=1 Tax=Magnaporthiopsis poae (strain ATCC 64411 / 73-15) TaxID=644358 RepID=A0A0C4DL13_MAGP6|nr:hypothetical protein MAPG_00447 [Magnaporthiopsis poae ATCC 64411]
MDDNSLHMPGPDRYPDAAVSNKCLSVDPIEMGMRVGAAESPERPAGGPGNTKSRTYRTASAPGTVLGVPRDAFPHSTDHTRSAAPNGPLTSSVLGAGGGSGRWSATEEAARPPETARSSLGGRRAASSTTQLPSPRHPRQRTHTPSLPAPYRVSVVSKSGVIPADTPVAELGTGMHGDAARPELR